eukprot:3724350-Pyramimonas_sp.AAC.1
MLDAGKSVRNGCSLHPPESRAEALAWALAVNRAMKRRELRAIRSAIHAAPEIGTFISTAPLM